jgi:hypothetical protein
MLAALGEWIKSTSPDYLFGFNGVTDDFIQLSGTSVATPIVSGAAVLVREALQVTAASDTSATRVREILRDTAQNLFDPVTNSNYAKLNLRGALQRVLGQDEAGSPVNPLSLGTLWASLNTSGILQEGRDEDAFRFRAGHTGQVTILLDWKGHALQRPMLISSSGTAMPSLELSVVAGQDYDVRVAGRGGVGRYHLNLTPRSTPVTIQAPAASFAESRLQWTAPDSGPRTVCAEFFSPPSVDQFAVTTGSGNTLFQVQNPAFTEIVSIHVTQGGVYEFIVRGKRAEARVDVLDELRSAPDDPQANSPDDSSTIFTLHVHSSPTAASRPGATEHPAAEMWHQSLHLPNNLCVPDGESLLQESWQSLMQDRIRQTDRWANLLARRPGLPKTDPELHDQYGQDIDQTWASTGLDYGIEPWSTLSRRLGPSGG